MKKLFPRSHLSNRKIKEIFKCFWIDIEASKTAKLTGISRNTVNKYYGKFRNLIASKQEHELFNGYRGI